MANGAAGPQERDTIRDVILPSLHASGWLDDQIVREYYLRARRTVSLGRTSRDLGRGFADIVLEATPGTPVAVVEAKREYRTAEEAIQQAIRYAQQLDAPLAYGSNGTMIIERNLRTGQERQVEAFASPPVAWAEYQAEWDLDRDAAELVAQPFNRRRRTVSGDVIEPRAYQVVAINRVLAAIARGDRRALLLMATGTGKTFTAMQIVAKLRSYEQHAHPERNYRVLYLADRDALLDQPMRKDFVPAFGVGVVSRVLGASDLSREIYFASYQALSTGGEAARLREFRADFFDLVIVDECHRGSAEENSAWRAVLDHFSSAVQLGLTATPRDDTVNSYEYFGNALYTYSLRQGIEDGYLAPYRVRRVVLSPDGDGWQPSPGELDRFRREVPEGVYSTRDFERVVSLLARTRLAARHLSDVLRAHPRPRAIVFCVDTEHAADMRRALIELNPDRVRDDPEWAVRIVGIEGERQRLLEEFCDPTRITPAVATTSRLLSTGIDVEDLTHVVLFRPVGSMVEFKQIIGRGSRLFPDTGKTSFDVIDYVGASTKFNDPAFDGYPAAITIEELDDSGEVVATTIDESGGDPGFGGVVDSADPVVNEPEAPFTLETAERSTTTAVHRKYYVDDGDFAVASETHLVPSTDSGRLELTEYGAAMQGRIQALGDAEALRREWAHAESREQLRTALQTSGVDLNELVAAAGGPDIDPIDALHHLAWNLPMRTRAERVRRVREAHDGDLRALAAQSRAVLEGLLQRYEEHGVRELESTAVFQSEPLRRLGSVSELAAAVGGPERLRSQLDTIQEWLYSA